MDMDCGPENVNEEILIKEEVIIKDEPYDIEDYENATTYAGLNLVPLVYTTRLDDMMIINSKMRNLEPIEVTTEILNESKPKLQILPNNNHRQCNKKKFYALKRKLKRIYHKNRVNVTDSDIVPGFPEPTTDLDSIKSEVLDVVDDASVSSEIEANSVVKCEVFDEPIVRTCKYSELLKLCRPCSVLLPILEGYGHTMKTTIQNDNPIAPDEQVTSEVSKKEDIIQKQSQYIEIDISSDDEPLIKPKANVSTQSLSKRKRLEVQTQTEQFVPYGQLFDENYKKVLISSFRNRILCNGVVKVKELYSKEYSIYCIDSRGNITDFYKGNDYSKYIDKHIHSSTGSSAIFPIKTCCWVHRDGTILHLYPNVLLYNSARFMRKPHTCPPDACCCCCKKAQNIYVKPDMLIDDALETLTSGLKQSINIPALHLEIRNSITKMKKERWRNSSNTSRSLPNNQKSLIDKAITYKKPLPMKPKVNRRLESSKLDNSQTSVIVVTNFAMDEREVFELSADGELKSYFKLTCFENTLRSDVKKLLQKTKRVSDVCCWFKRQKFITELLDSKTLHSSAVKFIRTRHTCATNQCNCCCKPTQATGVTLTDITFPSRPKYWPDLLQRIREPPKTRPDNHMVNLVKSMPTFSSPELPHATKPCPIAPKPSSELNKPLLVKVNPIGTQFRRTPIQRIKPISFTTINNPPVANLDCHFVGVPTIPTVPTVPTVRLEPSPVNSVNANQPNSTTNGQSLVESDEVNVLITSILDRFKDVRLTINTDGKVAAALNTPVSSLTTVELKVLANILSYAQTQVNSLGLNSGTRLSKIIDFKVNESQLATSVDSTSVSKAYGENININRPRQAAQVNKLLNTVDSNVVPEPVNFPNQNLNKNNIGEHFTKSLLEKSEGYTSSFASLLSTKLDAEKSGECVPVIQNVFSLNEQVCANEPENSSSIVFSRVPGQQKQRDSTETNKRTANTDITPPVAKKIRVLSPSKLQETSGVNAVNPMLNMIFQNVSTPTMQPRALQINDVRQVSVPLLPQNNIKVMPMRLARPPAPMLTKPRIIRINNFKAFSSSSSNQPSILVAPLQVRNDNVVQDPSTMETQSPVTSVVDSTQTEETSQEDIITETIKIEQDDDDEEVDCILGV